MAFNENSRVKIPTILHLCSLGYEYLPLSKAKWDISTNIFTGIFEENIKRLNPNMEGADFKILLENINLALDNEDLGKSFYEMLINTSGHTLIDFENFSNNKLGI